MSPDPVSGLRGVLGRPVWGELRRLSEKRELRDSPLWSGMGFPEGEGRPVLYIPGFLAGRTSSDAVMHMLMTTGWMAELSPVGRNAGPTYTAIERSAEVLRQLVEHSGRRVQVVGHSRGGQMGRVLAHRFPELVSRVVGVGTPFLTKYPQFAVVKLPAEALDWLWRRGVFDPVDIEAEDRVDADRYQPFPDTVDLISIYSKTDGIVDWRLTLDPHADTVQVDASHLGLVNSVAGISAIGQALNRPEPTVG